jgi:hypothetical protein
LVTAVVKNIYNLLRAKGVGKDQLPVMCTVGDDADVAADDPFRRFFIVDMHGVGDNIGCVGFTGVVVLRLLGSPLAITTLHRLVGRRIKALVDSISFACYDVDDAREEGLAVRIAGVQFREAVRTRPVTYKKREVIRLAFGLTLEPEAVVRSKRVEEEDERRDTGSCVSSGGELSSAPSPSATSASETDAPPPAAAPDVAVAARVPGLIGMERAPSSRTRCFICSEQIHTGEWRFDYLLKPSRRFSDIKRVHPHCVPELPQATKLVDYRFLQDQAARPALDPPVYELLDALASERRPHAAGVASDAA